MKQHAHSTMAFPSIRRPWLAAVPAFLVAFSGVGCYRATGIQRSDVVAEEIPSIGGDRTLGLKAEAAPGDFYLGNDSVELAIDGTPFGQGSGVAGAVAGGSIIDAANVELDQNFRRVSLPMDMLERLTPVLNQDPDLSLVFDAFQALNSADGASRLEMRGRVHDPLHKLAGATWDTDGRVRELKVLHVVSLGKQDRHFTLTTTIENIGSATLPVRNLGDLLFQRTGGFRFNVPANETVGGTSLNTWGIEIPATGPGTVFGDPGQAVKASMVAFMGVEPSGQTEDLHSTLGLLPMDADAFAITSDPQRALNEVRPLAPRKLVAGSLPVASLAAGAKLTHTRRLYLVGGASTSPSLPNQATGVFNMMEGDRFSLQSKDSGGFLFQPVGTAVRQGPWPAEFRIERKVDATTWKLHRLEWLEPYGNFPNGQAATGAPRVAVNLPVGTYRMVIRNGQATGNQLLRDAFFNTESEANPDVLSALKIESKTLFASNVGRDYLCPERDSVLTAAGSPHSYKAVAHSFVTRQQDGSEYSMQPLRIMVFGRGTTPDPSSKRVRSLGALFSSVEKRSIYGSMISDNFGVFGFFGGNQMFGASLPMRAPAYMWLEKGAYVAVGARGPLAPLESLWISAYDGQTQTNHIFTVTPSALPTGWTSLDLPGASLATSGGFLPMEKLSSALAEAVEVVGLTEVDRLSNGPGLTSEFRREFTDLIPEEHRTAIGSAPYGIGARSADLGGTSYGSATALFTPAPRNERGGGARSAQAWTLADFLAQAEGQYTVVHRPRGPQGLFTAKAFDRATALGTGTNAWWTATGALANGKTQGAFDALELLRAEYSDASGQPLSLLDSANATAWFTEFQAVRADWFALLNQQLPTAFTKGLGLSAARFSLDTPVGLARTYLKATGFTQDDLKPVLTALQSGAAVASTGPLIDATITPAASTTAFGPGSLVPAAAGWTLNLKVYAASWLPVDEVRVVINGVARVIPFNTTNFTQDATDPRLWTLTDAASRALTFPAGKDGWVVVEAGVPLSQTGAYRVGSDWSRMMKGVYPIAVSNPIFVKANAPGTTYTPPGL